jgi:hypothetical protein
MGKIEKYSIPSRGNIYDYCGFMRQLLGILAMQSKVDGILFFTEIVPY